MLELRMAKSEAGRPTTKRSCRHWEKEEGTMSIIQRPRHGPTGIVRNHIGTVHGGGKDWKIEANREDVPDKVVKTAIGTSLQQPSHQAFREVVDYIGKHNAKLKLGFCALLQRSSQADPRSCLVRKLKSATG